jgi:hypothetical protein
MIGGATSRANLAGAGPLKQSVKTRLKEAEAAIGNIADATMKKAMETKLAALKARQQNALADQTTSEQTLFTLDKDAMAFLESAHKAVFVSHKKG